jgi:hypothetical protein
MRFYPVHLLVAALVLTATLGAAQPPTAQPSTGGATELAVPTWVQIAPPCTPSGAMPSEPTPIYPGGPNEAASPAAVDDSPQPRMSVVTSLPQAAEPQITVQPETTIGQDTLVYHYDSVDGRIKFRYQADPGSTARLLELKFGALHEFLDADSNGILTGGDPVLRTVLIQQPLLHFARTWEADCGIRLQWVYMLTVPWTELSQVPDDQQAAYLQDKPRLTLRFTHLAAETVENGTRIVPQRVKIDIGVDDYDFQDANAKLAFESTLYAPDQASEEPDRVFLASEGGSIGYAWAAEVLVDGTMRPVAATVDANPASANAPFPGSAYNITFAYPMGRNLLHDPELGLLDIAAILREAAAYAQAHPQALAAGAAMGAAALLLLGLIRRRGA